MLGSHCFFVKGFCIVDVYGPEWKTWHGPSSDGGPSSPWFAFSEHLCFSHLHQLVPSKGSLSRLGLKDGGYSPSTHAGLLAVLSRKKKKRNQNKVPSGSRERKPLKCLRSKWLQYIYSLRRLSIRHCLIYILYSKHCASPSSLVLHASNSKYLK